MYRKQLAYWISQFTGWGMYIFLSGFSNYLNNELTNELILAFLAIFGSGLILSHLLRNFIVRMGWLNFSPARVIFPLLFSSAFLALLMGVLQLLYSAIIVGRPEVFDSLSFSSGFLIWLNWWVIFMVWSVIYFAVHFFEKSRNEEIKNLRLEAMKTEVELNNLKSQLNPHFMFNSMNSIRALIDENPALAKESITKLSNILRSTLLMGRKQLVTVEEELHLVDDYLKLEGIRYEERLKVDLHLDAAANGFLLPPLMVQTLVENAIKHGISRLPSGGLVRIWVKKENEKLAIRIENTGRLNGEQHQISTGIGIANTRQRLELLYDGKASFELFEENGMVIADVRLPVQNKL